MEVEFYGAAARVTGTCHMLRVGGRRILLDCGLIQGLPEDEALNVEPFPFDAAGVDAVVLSHGHIDHSGRLPLLVSRGFKGPVYTHPATRDLALVLLQDSARLNERDIRYRNRLRAKKKLPPLDPLYTVEDVVDTVNLMQGVPYGEKRDILPGVAIRFMDAGHILGSAMVEVWLTENGRTTKLVFSGDVGQYDSPILYDPAEISEADLVIVESTYGDRLHKKRDLTLAELAEIIRASRLGKGNILIPAFSIGRSQELLYLFGKYHEEWGLKDWQIYLDSPMAIEASRIYWQYPELYDEEATKLRRMVHEMPKPENLHFTRDVEASKKINDIDQGAIIIAGNGMCNGGRIIYHLRHNLERPECQVVITGFQAEGTLGREIVEGAETVRIRGDDFRVRAGVHTLGGLSAHGDRDDLLRWIRGFSTRPRMYVVHGEAAVKERFAQTIRDETGLETTVPSPGDVVDL
ncbi:MBL fold metallo-hydrolase [Prosthecochloris sp. GSB1]|uniref:MBL fold metallo-hydrolase RNA specificity domain-containing protein n=1 Tax=Prosthecochloris sp. GSB1 TaxID=281093 RepID=UPI000B8CE46F|nr:MBL fold metallo-hydrolase [Prosthecochloris sp. GSB1]ASQ90060.1 MBL fold metallo-hydrolase [Prosthecochloris sp. GSB1]